MPRLPDARLCNSLGLVAKAGYVRGVTLPAVPSNSGGDADRIHESIPDNVRLLRPEPKRFAQWPLCTVLLLMAISFAIVATDHFRRGAVLFSAAVVLAFFLRLLLSDADAGMLAVRSRKVDLIILGALALGVSVLSLVVPPPS